jgi:ubiquinone biosynthesis protein
MVVTEGVARQLDPELDMWSTAEPVVGAWLERRLSPEGRMRDAAEGAASLGRLVEGLPALFEGAERVASAFAAAQRGDPETARVKQREGVPRALWWIIAAALVVIALG